MPVLVSMKARIEELVENNNLIKDFKSIMLNVIDKRFARYLRCNAENKEFILSAVSMPRYKTSFIGDRDDKIYAKNLLIMECT